MVFCRSCGVRVEPGHQACPLCSNPLTSADEAALPTSQAFAREREAVISPDDLLRRRLGAIALVLAAVLVPTALVCILIDVLYGGSGWSRLVIALLVLTGGLGVTPRLFFHNPLVIGLVDVALIGAFLVAADLMGPWHGWSIGIGLPILGAVALAVVLGWLALSQYRERTGFVLATFLGIGVMLCLVIDATVSAATRGQVELLWSLIALATIGPLILTAVILQLILPASNRLRRYLHW
mgnify:FL=1